MLIKKTLTLLFIVTLAQGCLVFNSVSYEINLEGENSGKVKVKVNDIRSDAVKTSDLEEDKNQLFNFIWKSDDFTDQMKTEGKNITERNLFISDGKLTGTIDYTFTDISRVESIVYEEPFYFLTLESGDSVISTNGELIKSDNYQRIMWDNSLKTLKFEMFSQDVEIDSLVDLTKFFEEE